MIPYWLEWKEREEEKDEGKRRKCYWFKQEASVCNEETR